LEFRCYLVYKRNRKKNKKGGRRKSQNRYISPPRGGAISQPICTKSVEFVHLIDVNMAVKFGSKISIGLSMLRGGEKHFHFRKLTAYINSVTRYRVVL